MYPLRLSCLLCAGAPCTDERRFELNLLKQTRHEKEQQKPT